MYTALLQNQVLGIDNPYLLHEIHNSDELLTKGTSYASLQRQTLREEELSENAKHSLLSEWANDSSPFNSKFNVLKFNNRKQPNNSVYRQEAQTPKEIVSLSSSFSFNSNFEALSSRSSISTMSAISQNVNPLTQNF